MTDGFIGNATVVVPDLTEKVLGVRGFVRAGHFLASPFQGDPWRRPNAHAVCRPGLTATAAALTALGSKPKSARTAAQRILARQRAYPDHEVPDELCHCGLYAYHSLEDFAGRRSAHVVAAVLAWGPTVVHPGGFRAQRMEVVALALPDEMDDGIAGARLAESARRSAAWWRVPLLGLDELRASYREFGDPIPSSLIPAEVKDQ